MSINHKGSFSISKNYIIDLTNRKLMDTRNGQQLLYNLENKILIYEDRQKTWFFDVAEYLKIRNKEIKILGDGSEFDTNEAGFVILIIAVAYLESNQKYRNGQLKQSSTGRIKTALERIIPEMNNNQIKIFVDGVRNGLFHDGITKKGVFINASQNEIFIHNNEGNLIINPNTFLEATKKDFENYISTLKNAQNISDREKFELTWDYQKGI